MHNVRYDWKHTEQHFLRRRLRCVYLDVLIHHCCIDYKSWISWAITHDKHENHVKIKIMDHVCHSFCVYLEDCGCHGSCKRYVMVLSDCLTRKGSNLFVQNSVNTYKTTYIHFTHPFWIYHWIAWTRAVILTPQPSLLLKCAQTQAAFQRMLV